MEPRDYRRARLAESFRPHAVQAIEGMSLAAAASALGIGPDQYKFPEHYGRLVGKMCYAYADGMLAAEEGK